MQNISLKNITKISRSYPPNRNHIFFPTPSGFETWPIFATGLRAKLAILLVVVEGPGNRDAVDVESGVIFLLEVGTARDGEGRTRTLWGPPPFDPVPPVYTLDDFPSFAEICSVIDRGWI